MKSRECGCSRRQFLQRTARAALAGAAATPLVWRCSGADDAHESSASPRPVVIVERPQILDGRGRIAGEAKFAPSAEATAVLADALTRLTGTETLEASLATLFSRGERVGVKLNCLAGAGLSPQPPLVRALVDGLRQAGIAPGAIVVFERSQRDLADAGFPAGDTAAGAAFLANDGAGVGYASAPLIHRSIGSCFSRILLDRIDALINFGVLKDHNLAGVSIGLKNLFGLIHNPNKYHDHNCDPYVADVLDAPPVRDKLRLTLCDGMVAQFHGGPALMKSRTWNAGLFLASRDPVAIDAVGTRLIEEKRRAEGLSSLKEDGRHPSYIATASSYGLGEADLAAIPIVRP